MTTVQNQAPRADLSELVVKYETQMHCITRLANLPDGGSFDTPELEALLAARETVSRTIARSVPTTPGDAAHQLRWLKRDSYDLGLVGRLNQTALKNAIKGLQGAQP